jgi:nucleotide-binding universal stress UspA family protein
LRRKKRPRAHRITGKKWRQFRNLRQATRRAQVETYRVKPATSQLRSGPSPAGERSKEPTISFFQDPLRLTTIVVALDLSSESLRALDFALPLAKRFGAQVHLVHVYDGARLFSTVETSPLLWSEAEAKRHFADEVELTFGIRPPREECHLRIGKPAAEIVVAAKALRADLIVMAHRGQSDAGFLSLGRTTDKVLRTADCPVLVVRESSRGPIGTSSEGIVLQKILVPVDFSDCAKEGARYASVFGTAVGADLVVSHVVRPPLHLMEASRGAVQHWPRELREAVLEAEDKLDELVNSLPLLEISAETEVEVGVPAERLAATSARNDIDLIIMSTHGYSGLRHALLGSVAEELARTASCPVLVVPSHQRSGESWATGGPHHNATDC